MASILAAGTGARRVDVWCGRRRTPARRGLAGRREPARSDALESQDELPAFAEARAWPPSATATSCSARSRSRSRRTSRSRRPRTNSWPTWPRRPGLVLRNVRLTADLRASAGGPARVPAPASWRPRIRSGERSNATCMTGRNSSSSRSRCSWVCSRRRRRPSEGQADGPSSPGRDSATRSTTFATSRAASIRHCWPTRGSRRRSSRRPARRRSPTDRRGRTASDAIRRTSRPPSTSAPSRPCRTSRSTQRRPRR